MPVNETGASPDEEEESPTSPTDVDAEETAAPSSSEPDETAGSAKAS